MKKIIIVIVIVLIVIICLIFVPVIKFYNNPNESPPKFCAENYTSITITIAGKITAQEDMETVVAFVNEIVARRTTRPIQKPMHSPDQRLDFIKNDGTKENLLIWSNNYGNLYLIYNETAYQIHPFYNFNKRYRQLLYQLGLY